MLNLLALAAVLSTIAPSSQYVEIGTPAGFTVTVTNTSAMPQTCVPMGPASGEYLDGTVAIASTPARATIAPGAAQTFDVAVTAQASAFFREGLQLSCGGAITTTPMIAFGAYPLALPNVIMATSEGSGTLLVSHDGAYSVFSVAAENIGAPGPVIFLANSSAMGLPLASAVCQTDPTTGACLQPFVSASFPVQMQTGDVATFTVWVAEEVETLPAGEHGVIPVQAILGGADSGYSLGENDVVVTTE